LRGAAKTKSKTECDMTDGEKLLLERRRRGLAAWKLAAQAGIDPTTYSRIERGEREATYDQKLALARALGVEPESLFSRVLP
jgi:transcriptional regulator with XRE-family HTH domain